MPDRKIYWLLAAFVALGFLYAVLTPLFEISDELWHYPMVKTLADGDGLPVQDPATPRPWRQEGSQPPLYYALMALATFWIDTGDLDQVRWINPHTDNGLITEDRNNNIAIHPADESARWHGAALAVRLIRFLSVLMGAGTVYFTYRLALELLPKQNGLALAAASLTAFTPMFVFICASVNNDNLTILLSAATLWLLVRWVRVPPDRLGWPHLALGVLLGAGALSKQSALGLWALAAFVMLLDAGQATKARMTKALLVFGVALALSGWWYFRNWQLYGDWLGWNTFIAIVGARPQPASLWQLWGERVGFVQAYWGLFGGVSVPMPAWTYVVLNLAAAVAVIGLGWGLTLAVRRRAVTRIDLVRWGLLVAWIVLLFAGLIRWTSLTWASQGRLIFPAISALSVLIAVGLHQLHRALPFALGLFMAGLALAVPFAVIAPHYAPPPELTSEQIAAIPQRLEADFGGEMKLLGYALHTGAVTPGESVRLTLYWQSLIAMDRNWSVFVHLVDEDDLIVAQRDRYPGQGLLATTLLRPGQTWADEYVIPIPAGAYAPMDARLAVGLYDLRDGARLPLATGGDTASFGSVKLRAREAALPNALRQNVGGVIELSGYQIDRRVVQAGEAMTLTLYWRALAPIPANYSVSARVRGPDHTRWAAKDAWPQDGAAPTSTWQPGVLITDPYALTLDPNTPPGQYEVEVIVYDGQTLKSLQLWNREGYPTDAESIVLSRIGVRP